MRSAASIGSTKGCHVNQKKKSMRLLSSTKIEVDEQGEEEEGPRERTRRIRNMTMVIGARASARLLTP